MTTQARVLLSLAGLSLLVATIGGAVASHALTSIDAAALRSFETAVSFQFFQALGLAVIVLTAERHPAPRWLWPIAWLLLLGSVLFCGSIYAVTFGAPRAVLAVAPYGGVALMLAWLAFAAAVWRRRA
jgi:uncharacterized membrane protein YgdD (TMEM256/DUF423 family)